ncbi:uncharacterized protein LOC132739033 [Ruditapes philippinarum]|uniref:uncharacterized protein LOC132739033 n=1 Tax=Ruditapes philippinarum TaxID=129788 RepID=UPI00295B923A|nr:uncharacterized protein LOC132739033 [Ruditapes philippinarum]
MAAPTVKSCCTCLGKINGKNYRQVSSSASRYQYNDIFASINVSPTGFCCNLCVNILNRIRKCTEDETTIGRKLAAEKRELLQKFEQLPGVVKAQSTQHVTPTASKPGSTKRTISSPSGVTPKSKKSLFRTPQKITTPKRPSITHCGPKMVDASTETVTTCTRKPFDVKVTLVYNEKERSKIITDKVEKSAIKAIVNRKGPAAVVKHLLKSELYKSALLKCVSTEIIKETSALTKKPETDFKVSTTNKLMNFSWKDQFDIIKLKTPTLSSVLASFITKQKSMARFVVAVSITYNSDFTGDLLLKPSSEFQVPVIRSIGSQRGLEILFLANILNE